MRNLIFLSTATSALMLACGASHPPPTQQMADAQAATRSASELGAGAEPRAQLHLKLAEEQMAQAKSAMEKDDNASAERLLLRAKSDAELAVALMHEHDAKETSAKADQQSDNQQSDNQRSTDASQGATP
jgi:hypothetical protein